MWQKVQRAHGKSDSSTDTLLWVGVFCVTSNILLLNNTFRGTAGAQHKRYFLFGDMLTTLRYVLCLCWILQSSFDRSDQDVYYTNELISINWVDNYSKAIVPRPLLCEVCVLCLSCVCEYTRMVRIHWQRIHRGISVAKNEIVTRHFGCHSCGCSNFSSAKRTLVRINGSIMTLTISRTVDSRYSF